MPTVFTYRFKFIQGIGPVEYTIHVYIYIYIIALK